MKKKKKFKRQLSKPLQEVIWDVDRVCRGVDKLKRDMDEVKKDLNEVVLAYMDGGRRGD